MNRLMITLMAAAVLVGCNGGGPADGPGGQNGESPQPDALVQGDGSDLCLQEGDLPEGYLPIAGSDNTQNAIDNVFADPDAGDAAEHVAAAWLALPQGGAGQEDRTADCSIYLFDTAEIDEIYAWYADTLTTRSDPPPVEVSAPSGGPGEDPRLYHHEPNPYSGREGYTYVFRFRNAIVNVGVDAVQGNASVDDVVTLAEIVHGRLESAA